MTLHNMPFMLAGFLFKSAISVLTPLTTLSAAAQGLGDSRVHYGSLVS